MERKKMYQYFFLLSLYIIYFLSYFMRINALCWYCNRLLPSSFLFPSSRCLSGLALTFTSGTGTQGSLQPFPASPQPNKGNFSLPHCSRRGGGFEPAQEGKRSLFLSLPILLSGYEAENGWGRSREHENRTSTF